MSARGRFVAVAVWCLWCAEAGAVGPPVRVRVDRYGDRLPADAVARFGTTRFSHVIHDNDGVAFSEDGKRVAAANAELAKVWDVATGREVARVQLSEYGRSNWLLSFGRTGRTLTAIGQDRMLRSWDLASGRLFRKRLLGHDEEPPIRPYLSAFSADGKLVALVSGTPARSLTEVYEAETAKRVIAVPRTGGAQPPALSPDGKWLAVRSASPNGAIVRVVSLRTGEERELTGCPEDFGRLAFSPDGKALASSYTTGKTYLWDLTTDKGRAVTGGDKAGCAALAFTPDGKQVIVCGHKTYLFDRATGKPALTSPTSAGTPCALSSDGKRLAFVRYGRVAVVGVRDGRDVCPLEGHVGGVAHVGFSPDGKRLLSAGGPPAVVLWDVATARQVRRWGGRHEWARQVAFARGGRTALACVENDLLALDVSSGRRSWREKDTFLFAASPDGALVATFRGNELSLREAVTGKARRRLALTAGARADEVTVRAAAFSPDGRGLLVSLDEGGDDLPRDRRLRQALLLDLGRAAPRPVGQDHDGAGTAPVLAWSPAGHHALLVDDRGAALWDMWTNRISRAIRTARENEGVSRAAISPDGKWLAVPHGPVAGVSLYEVATGSRAFRFASPDGDVTALTFAPDGRSLAGGTSAGSILLWRLLGPEPAARGALTSEQRGRLWSDLGSSDPARAFRAVRALGGAAGAVPLLTRRLRSLTPPVTHDRLARLIADLDADTFAARQKATDELDRLGALAEPAMRNALADRPSLEAAQRLERLLRRAAAARPSADHLRVLRAVAVLELVGSPQALRLLDGLARHSPHPAGQSEARAARDRLLRFR